MQAKGEAKAARKAAAAPLGFAPNIAASVLHLLVKIVQNYPKLFNLLTILLTK
jgi:hypothetical protein